MRAHEFITEDVGTVSGAVAVVVQPLGQVIRRMQPRQKQTKYTNKPAPDYSVPKKD
jgi:hypothetical protein